MAVEVVIANYRNVKIVEVQPHLDGDEDRRTHIQRLAEAINNHIGFEQTKADEGTDWTFWGFVPSNDEDIRQLIFVGRKTTTATSEE